VGNRTTLFTVEKADTLVHRTSGPAPARMGSYPRLHEEVLRSLIRIAKRHPQDGDDRVPDLLVLAQSIPANSRLQLYARLPEPGLQDAYAAYLRQSFPITGSVFLQAIGRESESPGQVEPTTLPAQRAGTHTIKGSEFVTDRYSDVRADPMYIDNFSNDIT